MPSAGYFAQIPLLLCWLLVLVGGTRPAVAQEQPPCPAGPIPARVTDVPTSYLLQPLPHFASLVPVVSTSPCDTYVGPPQIYSGEPAIAIGRIISRSVDMHNLVSFNAKATGYVYEGGTVDSTRTQDSPIVGSINYDATAPPGLLTHTYNDTYLGPPLHPRYDMASGAVYHPETYAKSIQLLVDLDAQLITRVASASYGNELNFFTPSPYQAACRQVIVDINAAYDSHGLRRPLIGAAVLEVVGPLVSRVAIEPAVIAAFQAEIDALGAETRAHYAQPGPIYYDTSRIRLPNSASADITKIETRLLFYQEATAFIRLGYRALHMGMYWVNGRNDVGYRQTAALYDRIRGYARSLGAFVLLSSEISSTEVAGMRLPSGDDGFSARIGRSDTLLFDFDGRPTRPRQFLNTSFPARYGCDGPFTTPPPASCTEFRAVVDPCVLENMGGSSGGISPLSRTITASGVAYPPLAANIPYQQVPYHVYIDFWGGWDEQGPYDDPKGSPNAVYGNDDAKWFAERLSSACKADWLVTFYADRRRYHQGNGYLQIPGILTVKMPENLFVKEPLAAPRRFNFQYPNLFQNGLSSSIDGYYVMANEDAGFINQIKDMLRPAPLALTVEPVYETHPCTFCLGEKRRRRALPQLQKYRVVISQPDMSSLYTIQVQGPDGQSVSFRGTGADFYPLEAGDYTFYARQDNPGLDAAKGKDGTEDMRQVSQKLPCEVPDTKAARRAKLLGVSIMPSAESRRLPN